MVTCDVSNLCAMSATSTRPSRPRISTIARRRSSLSTLFLKRQYSSRKLGIMIALSFYIGCFRLSSVRESKLVDGAEPCSAQVAQNANAGLAVAASRFAQKRTAGAQRQLLGSDVRSLQGPRCYKPYYGMLRIRSRRGESIY